MWSYLPRRAQCLLAGLTVLADDPVRLICSASYRVLLAFLGGKSQPQVPQAANLATKYGVLDVWAAADESVTGCTVYLFPFYVEALALGLALKCGIEVSVTELKRAHTAGLTFKDIRDAYLRSADGQSNASMGQPTYSCVDNLGYVENFNIHAVGKLDQVNKRAYPVGEAGEQQSENPSDHRSTMHELIGNMEIPVDVNRDVSTAVHTPCGRSAAISTENNRKSTKLTGFHSLVRAHCIKPTISTKKVSMSYLGGSRLRPQLPQRFSHHCWLPLNASLPFCQRGGLGGRLGPDPPRVRRENLAGRPL